MFLINLMKSKFYHTLPKPLEHQSPNQFMVLMLTCHYDWKELEIIMKQNFYKYFLFLLSKSLGSVSFSLRILKLGGDNPKDKFFCVYVLLP